MAEKIKLTKTVVEALALPEKGPVFVWDSELRGFGVKLTATGGRTYFAESRVNGKTRRVTLGKHGVITPDRARKKAIQALGEMSDGVDPNAKKREEKALAVTLKQVVEAYISDRGDKLRPATLKDFDKHLGKSFKDWSEKPFYQITRDKCAARHKELSKKSPAQADQAFRYLKAWLNYARAAYRPDGKPLLLENPVAVLDKQERNLWNKTKPREIRISDDKIGTAWNMLQEMRAAQLSPTQADIICFLLLTGCR
jgi:hypothetical protein